MRVAYYADDGARAMTPRYCAVALLALVAMVGGTVSFPAARADNNRLNGSVFVNIYTAQRENGCTTEPRLDGRLVDAARQHTLDVLNNRDINGDVGSDGSTPQDRANAAGFVGKVAETVAINPAMAISGIEILNQWWYDPPSRAAMQDCANTAIGVWSENSLARSVVVAEYGQPGTT
jgi:uncharacterized protein YkwD